MEHKRRVKVLREALRHYNELYTLMQTEGVHVLEAHGMTISLFDLRRRVDALPLRQRQALELHITLDLKQRDVARIMGTAVPTIGQYVVAALERLAEDYFADEDAAAAAQARAIAA